MYVDSVRLRALSAEPVLEVNRFWVFSSGNGQEPVPRTRQKPRPEIHPAWVRCIVRFALVTSQRRRTWLPRTWQSMSATKVSSLGSHRFGTYFAHKIRKRRLRSMRRSPQWQCTVERSSSKKSGRSDTISGALSTIERRSAWNNPYSREAG